MEIPRDLRPADPVARRRVQAAADRAAAKSPEAGAKPPTGAAVQRFVEALKAEDPARLHRVEDLRTRIANGQYGASAEELADLILGPPPGGGTGAG
jgi:anti-sigma28 factor (negative regulator of flagellin synthesis)